ncbi:MAG: hypothetical protein HWQ38_03180, partial [Nostoc sp. NMS7]|nr:hypothetical protein [Nostoc sp. NMS7]
MESNKPPLTASDGRTPLTAPARKPQEKADIFHTLAKWLVLLISIIPRFLASIMEHFSEAGSVGGIALGSLVFVVGVLFTADSYWQSLFGGAALFPFFEQVWAGWSWLPGFTLYPLKAWAGIIFNPAFIFAVALSFVIQIIQSATIRNAAFQVKATTKLQRVRVSLWKNLHFRKAAARPMLLLRVERLNAQGNLRVFKPLWLAWVGE